MALAAGPMQLCQAVLALSAWVQWEGRDAKAPITRPSSFLLLGGPTFSQVFTFMTDLAPVIQGGCQGVSVHSVLSVKGRFLFSPCSLTEGAQQGPVVPLCGTCCRSEGHKQGLLGCTFQTELLLPVLAWERAFECSLAP